MSDASKVVDSTTLQRTAQVGRAVVVASHQVSNATLEILPLEARCPPSRMGWIKARQTLGQLASLPFGWNGTKGDRPDTQTIVFAAMELVGLERSGAPAPTINPSPDGAIYAEWHASGLDIEVIFEAPYKVVALIEDAKGDVTTFEGEDTDLEHTFAALRILCTR